MKKVDNRALLLVGAGLLGLAVMALVYFLGGDEKADVGRLSVAVTLSGGRGVTALEYKLTGNGLAPQRAAVAVSGAAASLTVEKLPPGTGYGLELSAASPDGKIKCGRRASFDITADTTTSLELAVQCRDLGRITEFAAARRAASPKLAAEVTPPPAVEVAPECVSCEKDNIASGACEPDSGCEGLAGEDRRLCQNLVNCMRATNCWVKDPLDCLCGTVDYVECTKYANGDCKAEMQAATRTTDPIKNGTLFYDPTVTAGHANRLISCDKERCINHCAL